MHGISSENPPRLAILITCRRNKSGAEERRARDEMMVLTAAPALPWCLSYVCLTQIMSEGRGGVEGRRGRWDIRLSWEFLLFVVFSICCLSG